MRSAIVLALVAALGCSTPHHAVGGDDDGPDAATMLGDAGTDGDISVACRTHITYGDGWIHGASHPSQDDHVDGDVTWDGSCTDDGANSYAMLSNGFKPYFQGQSACAIALDHTASCASHAVCKTRITYGSAWIHPQNHPNQYDDSSARVFWDGSCASSTATLSNGWRPVFNGANACAMSLRWTDCGGLYQNPVVPTNCPDPGVTSDGTQYIMACTSGNSSDAFPIYTSTDLVHWAHQGFVLPSAAKPAWAASDFWAPEIHPIGGKWVAYFSARQAGGGKLAVGAASADSPTGPFTALQHPLIADPNMGLIDASEFKGSDGKPYLMWKEDGNAVGAQTPIHARALAPDGLSLDSAPTLTLITNDRAWEGAVVEGPFMIQHGGMFYLFYSGNNYASTAYGLGVARATTQAGPFTKAAAPILTSNAAWSGPGHGSVVSGHADLYLVYHAWTAGQVGGGNPRSALVDQIEWTSDGWPVLRGAPSSASRPLP